MNYTYNQIGTMYRLLAVSFLIIINFQVFSQYKNSADSLLQVVKSAPDSVKADLYLDVALAYRTLDVKKAYQYARLGLNLAEEKGINPILADAHNILGSIYTNLGDFEKANNQLLEALKLNELLGRTRGVANTANSIGILYFNQQDYENALKYYNKAYQLVDTINYKGGYATFSLNIGEVYQVKGELDKSKPLINKALRIFEEIEDDEGIAYCHGVLAKIHFEEDSYKQALKKTSLALQYFKKDQNELGTVEYYILSSEIYKSLADFNNAEMYAKEALKIAEQLKSLHWEMKSHETLAQLYEVNLDYKSAYFHIDTAKELRTQLLDEKTQEKIHNLRIIYETDNLIQENKILKINSALDEKTINEQKAISYTTAFFLLVLAIFAYFIYRANKSKQRKNKLLKIQNEEIKQQREEILTQAEGLRTINKEISHKNDLIEKKNKDITDSINYAKRIQTALLPFRDRIAKSLPQHFILYKPKDIVSGDFYWFRDFDDKVVIVVADCTGHGIPGAFMSFIGHDLLNYICNIKGIHAPDQILEEMNRNVIRLLRQKTTGNRDGLDVSICVWDKKESTLSFSGANHSLIYIQNKNLVHLKGDRTTIGMDERSEDKHFKTHKVAISEDTEFYLYTDGYVDQFGGPKDKKFMVAPFKEMLLKNHLKQMSTQKEILEDTLFEWMGDQEQVDDILVFGFRLFD